MSGVTFDFEWMDVPGRTATDVAATMARIEIRIDDHVVTRVFDKRGRSVRDGIITPLAPIAEWLAANWWALLEECANPKRPPDEFASRHDLRFAERGFPLPDLRITPEGETTFCGWQPRETQFGTIDFFGQHTASVPSAELRAVLWNFVEAVVARLRDRHVVEARLPDLWNSVSATLAEEERFCRIAGRLGLDPYDVSGEVASQLNRLDEELPSEICDEFAAAVAPNNLTESMQWVSSGLAELRKIEPTAETFSIHQGNSESCNGAPWSRGYRLAREFRETVGQSDRGKFDIETICKPRLLFASSGKVPTGLNAVVRSQKDQPLIYSVNQRPESLRFLLARALFACCESSHAMEAVITTAETAWQKQSRAFAAELLAPGDYLRTQVRRDTLGPDDITDLAADLEVSPWVIERQIVNHNIAQVELSAIG